MADDTEAKVKITADASGVTPGVEAAKSDLSGLTGFVEKLRSQFATFGDSLKTAFSGAAAGTAEAKVGMEGLNEETRAETLSLREMASSMKETALSVHEGVESFNNFKGAIREAFEAYLAFTGIEMFGEMAEKMGEAAEQTEHLAQRFGMTTDQVQGLKGAALATGVSVDSVTRSMTLLDKKFETDPAYFKKLGIDIKAGASQMDILNAVADKFQGTADGPNKTAMALELMGRNGAAAVPFLNQGAAGIQDLIDKAKSYGEVNKVAVESGVALAESVNEGKMAWDGLKQTMTEAFAPLLTELVDGFNGLVKAMTASYQSGGAVKTIFVAIVDEIEGFGEIFNSIGDAVGQVFKEMGYSAGSWGSGIKTVIDDVVWVTKLAILGFTVMATEIGVAFDNMKGNLTLYYTALKTTFENAASNIEQLKIDFQTLGTVMYDALTLNWGSIAADWDAGMAKVAAVAKAGAAKIKQDLQDGQAKAKSDFGQGDQANAQLAGWAQGFMKPHAKPAKTGVQEHDSSDDQGPDLNTAKTKKDKGPSEVEQWKSDLADQLLAEKNWGADSIQFTLAYWQEKQTATKAGTKEWFEVHKEVQKAQLSAFKEEQTEEINTIKQTLATKATLAKDDNEIAKIGLQEKLAAIDEEEKAGNISAVKASQMRASANQDLIALDRSYATTIYQMQVAALNQELALLHLPATEQKKIDDQLIGMKADFYAKMKVMDAQAGQQAQKDTQTTTDDIRAKWQNVLNPAVQAWGQSLQKMITGAGTFRDMMGNIGSAILGQGIQWIEKIVVKFAAGEAAKLAAAITGAATRTGVEATAAATSTGISATAALTQIAHSAALAAARVYAAIAAIPVVGPYLAPAAAALALAAVIKIGQSVFSAEDGAGDVPYDNAPFLLHKREMVLPAPIADSIRAMSSSGVRSMGMPAALPHAYQAANTNAPAAANQGGGSSGGDVHMYFNGPSDKAGIAKWVMSNKAAVHAAVRQHIRDGGGTKPL